MRELSVAEQRYRAVLAVISDGRTIKETAAAVGVSRQTMHGWLGKYEAGGLEGPGDWSHRPRAVRIRLKRLEMNRLPARTAINGGRAVERYKKATAR
jgi:transposase-like protein